MVFEINRLEFTHPHAFKIDDLVGQLDCRSSSIRGSVNSEGMI